MPRKESTKQKTKKDCDSEKGPVKRNHPEWYLREAVPHQIGLNFAALTSVEPLYTVDDDSYRMNAAYQMYTMVGVHKDDANSYGRMMSHLYAMIREKNAGAANYNPTYLGSYIALMEQLHAGCYSALRMLKAAKLQMQGWKDTPYIMPAVVGIKDYEEFTSNLANFQNDLALIIKEVENLPVPVDMSVFQRIRWLYSSVFMDENSQRAAPMAFIPYLPQAFSVSSEGELTLDMADITFDFSSSFDFTDVISRLQTMLRIILNNDKFAIMRGDLIKAYGYNKIDMMSEFTAPLAILYDEWALAQIENANVPMTTGFANENPKTIVIGSDGITLNNCQLSFPASTKQRATQDDFFVQAPDGNPDFGYLLSVTRLMETFDDSGNLTSCNGDFIFDVRVITDVNSYSVTSVGLGSIYKDAISTTQSTAVAGLATLAWVTRMFNHFPLVYSTIDGGSLGKISGTAYLWNVDDWATMTKEQLTQLNELAIRSMFMSDYPRRN